MKPRLLSVRDLAVRFDSHRGSMRAVDGLDLDLAEEETLALVGESGSGKSATCLALLRLLPATSGRIERGSILLRGRDLAPLSDRDMRRVRGRELAIVFQDPMTALHPMLSVGLQLAEVLEAHLGLPRREARVRAARALGEVGLPAPEALLARLPSELSGGQRQRVSIAMALLLRPALLVADEPTTALDVTLQAQILELLADLRRAHGMAVLLVTHDLGVVAECADRVLVLYAGRAVESAAASELFRAPRHPYTRGLLASLPTVDAGSQARLAPIPGEPPDLARLPPGCAFAPRCAFARERCTEAVPALEPVPALATATSRASGANRRSACFEVERLALAEAP
jgi:oligopeptide/dipeptide ABC transporter ATP-binding protein